MNYLSVLRLLLLSMIVLCIQSCGNTDSFTFTNSTLLLDQKITVNGLEREYHLLVPKDPTNKPVVVLLHGHGGSSNQSIGREASKNPQRLFLSLAEQQGFIVAIPNGSLGPEDTRGWNDCRTDAKGNPDTDDVAFIRQLLDYIGNKHQHDESRVYVIGVSNGALMTNRLVQEMPEKIAAFASIVNTMPVYSQCADSRVPVSALFMNGTNDRFVPYEGGSILGDRGQVISTDKSIDYWVNRNDTKTRPVVKRMPNINKKDKSSVTKYTYSNGRDNTEVILYKVIDGGHTEPSLVERYKRIYLLIVGEQNGDLEMATEVWNFFKTKSK